MSKRMKKAARQSRHRRVRGKINGTATVPRMSVCRTGKHIYVQFINDETRQTMVAASTLDAAFRETEKRLNLDGAALVGKLAAERALAADIKQVVFDRGGFRYHGRIRAVADAAREAGLKF